MLEDDDPAVMAELNRRMQVRAKADAKLGVGDEPQAERMVKDRVGKPKKDDTKAKGSKEKEKDSDVGKWQLTHQQLAESRALVYQQIIHTHCGVCSVLL